MIYSSLKEHNEGLKQSSEEQKYDELLSSERNNEKENQKSFEQSSENEIVENQRKSYEKNEY